MKKKRMVKKLPSNSKLKKHLDFVSLLGRQGKSAKKRKNILTAACPGDIDACAELFANFLKGNLKVSNKVIKRLGKHQNVIRQIADKRLSRKKKKILLGTQAGGFLQYLLPAVAPLAVQAFRKLFKL